MRALSTGFLLSLLVLLPLRLAGQESNRQVSPIPVTTNWGVKAGFTAAISLLQDFSIGGTPVEQVQNDYKVGYFASVFMRINFDRHFLQPEVSYNVNQCGVSFTMPSTNDGPPSALLPNKSSIDAKIHSIDIPIIYGYNFIKEAPYAMSVFGGPKIRYIWRHQSDISFEHFAQEGIREELRPFNLSLTLGVAVTISRIFFDFRYDLGLLNMSRGVTLPTPTDGATNDEIRYRRRDNVLSFSFGVLF